MATVTSTRNSFTGTINDSDTWNGQQENVNKYQMVAVSCMSNHNLLLNVYFSIDGSIYEYQNPFAITANIPFFKTIEITGRFVYLSLDNDPGSNADVKLLTRYNITSTKVDVDSVDISLDSSTDSVTVVAENLSIRPLTNSDVVTVEAANLDIRNLSANGDSVFVVANALDIRHLSHGNDSVITYASSDVHSVSVKNMSDKCAQVETVGNTAFEVWDGECFVKHIILTNGDAMLSSVVNLYDKASAPNPASDVPLKKIVVLPLSQLVIDFSHPLHFANGCYVRAVDTYDNTDTSGSTGLNITVNYCFDF